MRSEVSDSLGRTKQWDQLALEHLVDSQPLPDVTISGYISHQVNRNDTDEMLDYYCGVDYTLTTEEGVCVPLAMRVQQFSYAKYETITYRVGRREDEDEEWRDSEFQKGVRALRAYGLWPRLRFHGYVDVDEGDANDVLSFALVKEWLVLKWMCEEQVQERMRSQSAFEKGQMQTFYYPTYNQWPFGPPNVIPEQFVIAKKTLSLCSECRGFGKDWGKLCDLCSGHGKVAA